MQQPLASPASTPAVWIGALLSAFLGAAILFDALAGINWGIWVASAAAAVILSRRFSGLAIDRPLLILLGWATLLAFAVGVTDEAFIRVLVIASDAMLLGLAVIVTGTTSWRSLSAKLLATIPFLALVRVWLATFREAAMVPHSTSSARARPIVRGLLITIPIVIALVLLLRNADPVFAWIADRVADILPQWSFSARALFFLFLASLTLGASSIAASQTEPRLPSLPLLATRTRIGVTEQRMVLTSIAVLLWLFVLLQGSYLLHPPPSAVGSGVSFADFARNGFAQLSVAVTLVGAIILVLEATRPADIDARQLRLLTRLEMALVIALEFMLISAFRRVILYEQAYGFTTTRVFAQAYMVVLALALVALWLEIGRGLSTVDFGRRASVIALGVFTILAFWNFEAWIVNRNIDLSQRTGKFDSLYSTQLSDDVVPTLVTRRGELPTLERDQLNEWLACTSPTTPRRWFEFNASARAARAARLSIPLSPCPQPRLYGGPRLPQAPDTTEVHN
ncbi:MAG: DUF4173 domain-containing protein [Gemmatimonadaceae bacterium]